MVTETVPGVAMSEAETGAVSWLALTNVVVSWVVFHRMIAPETKPVPLAVIVKPPPPAVAVWGLRKLSAEEDVWIERFVL